MGRPAASGSNRPPSRSAGRYGRLLAAGSMRPRGNQGGANRETFLRSFGAPPAPGRVRKNQLEDRVFRLTPGGTVARPRRPRARAGRAFARGGPRPPATLEPGAALVGREQGGRRLRAASDR